MNYLDLYASFLKKFIDLKRPLNVVFDCSNGTTSLILKRLKLPNLKFIIINSKLDGDFPAHGPDPLRPGATNELRQKVIKTKADLGVVFDADGDRAFFVDNRGRVLPSFVSACLFTLIENSAFVVDVITAKFLEKLDFLRGEKIVVSRVGHIFIKDKMKQAKAGLGAEFSGHYYFKDFFYADSGILAAIKMLNIVSQLPYSLADFYDFLPRKIYSTQINVRADRPQIILAKIKNFYRQKIKSRKEFDSFTFDSGDYWFNVRVSDTEPLVRITLGAFDARVFRSVAEKIKRLT